MVQRIWTMYEYNLELYEYREQHALYIHTIPGLHVFNHREMGLAECDGAQLSSDTDCLTYEEVDRCYCCYLSNEF